MRARGNRVWILLAALLAVALVAAACGSDDDGEDATAEATAEATEEATEEPTEEATEEATAEVTEEATEEATAEPTEEPTPAGPPEETRGFDGSTIRLGYITDQTSPLAILGNGLLKGSEGYWNWVNEELGGIGGQYPVELVVADGQDNEAETVKEYQRIRDDVVMLAQILSTPPTQALLEFLEEDDMLGVPGSLGGAWVLEPNLVPNGTSYEVQMIDLADWWVNESGQASDSDVYCVLKVDDKYGDDSMDGIEHAAAGLGLELKEVQSYSRADASFTPQVTALNDAGCTVVFAASLPTQQNAILQEGGALGFDPVWLGTLPTYLNLFAAGSPDLWAKVHVAQDTPTFNDTSVAGMATHNERWAAYGDGDPNTFTLSGYFQSIAIHALLEAAVAAGDLSPEGMIAAYAGLGEVELDGLGDNYVYGVPADRVPPGTSRIMVFDPDNPPNLQSELAQIKSSLIDTLEYE
jgi:ABC-type branched-subunit amino acid transport system substrate-binding protein